MKSIMGGVTTYYVGNYYEWTGSTSTMIKYYYAGSQRVAMRQGSNTLYFLLGDHLGSTSLTTNSSGSKVAELRYHPWGGTRYTSGTTPTARRFTGQIEDAAVGLYFYNARYYDGALGRFIQADTIVPSPQNPQSLNRYAYTLNNPLRYTDPSGHFVNLAFAATGFAIGAIIGAATTAIPQIVKNAQAGQPLTSNIDPGEVAKNAAIGAATGAIGGLTFGVGLAAGGAIAGAIGVTSASGVAATAIGVTTVAASGVAAGQTSRATDNLLRGQALTEGLFQPEDMLVDAAFSLISFKILGGNFNGIAPSSITQPGAFARESIPATGPRVTQSQSARIQQIGSANGCHTCGTRQPGGAWNTWVGDHVPPTRLAGGQSQMLYPQCASCSSCQGSDIARGVSRLVYPIWNGVWRSWYMWAPFWQIRENGNIPE